MREAIKTAAITFAGLCLIALVAWLTGAGDKIIGWFQRSQIDVQSVSRGGVPIFLAGEQIRFSLKDASPDRVLWGFEETEFQPGSTQIEHAFPFGPSKPAGIESTRRVDVFFREGTGYRTAWIHVRVSNLKFILAKVINGKTIALQINQPSNPRWQLKQVLLGKLEGGKFRTATEVAVDQSWPDKSIVVNQDELGKVGVTLGPRFDPENAKGINAYFEFVDRDGKRLKTAEDLDQQIRELQVAYTDKPRPPA